MIRITGLETLIRKLDKDTLLKSPVRQLLTQAAALLDRETKLRTPVDTGRLRAGWNATVDKAPFPMWANVANNVEYAPFVEFGTSRMEARHVSPQRGVSGGSRIPRILGTGPMTEALGKTTKPIEKILRQIGGEVEKIWGKR